MTDLKRHQIILISKEKNVYQEKGLTFRIKLIRLLNFFSLTFLSNELLQFEIKKTFAPSGTTNFGMELEFWV